MPPLDMESLTHPQIKERSEREVTALAPDLGTEHECPPGNFSVIPLPGSGNVFNRSGQDRFSWRGREEPEQRGGKMSTGSASFGEGWEAAGECSALPEIPKIWGFF